MANFTQKFSFVATVGFAEVLAHLLFSVLELGELVLVLKLALLAFELWLKAREETTISV